MFNQKLLTFVFSLIFSTSAVFAGVSKKLIDHDLNDMSYVETSDSETDSRYIVSSLEDSNLDEMICSEISWSIKGPVISISVNGYLYHHSIQQFYLHSNSGLSPPQA